MEIKKNKEIKKERHSIFTDIIINNKVDPFSKYIGPKQKEINDICKQLYYSFEKRNITRKGSLPTDSFVTLKYFFRKYLDSEMDKFTKNKKPKNNIPKKSSLLYSKIYFGSFLNSSIDLGYKKNGEMDIIKSKLSKSNNFSFVNDPSTIRYKKLPIDLYISKEDSLKIKNLISVRPLSEKLKIKNNKTESKLRFSYDRGIFDNTSINFEKNSDKISNYDVFYINKNKLNEKDNIDYHRQISKNNFTEPNNLFINEKSPNKENRNTDSHNKPKKKKLINSKNLSELNNISENINPINIEKNIYNKTEYNNHSRNKNNPLLLQIHKKTKNFSKYRTPKKSIENFAKCSKRKTEIKLNKINRLINKGKMKTNPKLIINDLKIYGNKKKKKAFIKEKYSHIKRRLNLISIVENLKNIKTLAPMDLLNQIYEEYKKESKKIITDKFRNKRIDNIYKSSEEGKLIKKKIDKTNDNINKFISKNYFEGIKLKNKYKKLDLVINQINEENKANFDNRTEY